MNTLKGIENMIGWPSSQPLREWSWQCAFRDYMDVCTRYRVPRASVLSRITDDCLISCVYAAQHAFGKRFVMLD